MNRHILTLAAAAGALLVLPSTGGDGIANIFGVSRAAAQNIQNQPWGFGARNRSMAAQYQYQDRILQNGSSGGSDGGLGALQQYVTTYNSSSTAIGNMTEVNQNLSGGSTGSVGSTQDSQGSQGADAATDVTQTNTNSNNSNSHNTSQTTTQTSQNSSSDDPETD